MQPKVLLCGEGNFDNYTAALRAAGAVVCRETGASLCCDGLVLPGGGDIEGRLDAQEHLLIQSFVETQRPVLGICRGMQALNVFFRGTLYRRIPGHQSPGGDILHRTYACGCLAGLLGSEPIVNSNHHQAVRELGERLTAEQWAHDGTIEGLRHEQWPIWGVQWHPERQSYGLYRPDAVDAAPLWEAFLRQMR